ncbi:ubiquitin-related domain-containing protein [Lactifluus subvellereus]|nr:ubiquitin-related domain-containing protein [Lactifluus subvellereus]
MTKSVPVEVAALPASTRTSFTRVDNTPPGTSVDQRDEVAVVGGPPPDDDDDDDDVIVALPQTLVQFLLVSGRRRTMGFEPETTVGRVKELVWNSWPNDWQDDRPPAPSYLRVLYLGKILQDEDTLTQLKFPSHTPPEPATPTIVHLSIRSFAPREDLSVKKKRRIPRSGTDVGQGGGDGSSNEHGGACCCVIC